MLAFAAESLVTMSTIEEANLPAAAASETADVQTVYAAAERQIAGAYGSLTAEHLLYGLSLVVALVLRLLALGEQPLSPHEAGAAWPAFLAATGATVVHAPQPDSALLLTLQTLMFWMAGAGELLARVGPALAGSALVIMPWWWRRRLGQNPALFMTGLLAIDPWLTALSRTGDGAMLSVLLTGIVLTALWRDEVDPSLVRPQDRTLSTESAGDRGWPIVGAVAAGLLLVSGAQAWSFLVVIGVGGATAWRVLGVGRLRRWLSPSWWAWCAGAALLGATGWLVQLQNLAIVSTSLTRWLQQLTGPSDAGYPLSWPFVRLVVDQPFLLVFGLAGLLIALLGQRRRPEAGASSSYSELVWFGAAWLGWSLLLILAPGRTPFVLALLSIPLAAFAAHAIAWVGNSAARVTDVAWSDADWREASLLALVLGVLATAGLFWVVAWIFSPESQAVLAQTPLAILALAVLLLIAYAVWMNKDQALVVGAALVGVALLGATVSANVQLNLRADADRPDGFFSVVAHSGTLRLVEDVQTLSAQRIGDPTESALQVVTGADGRPDALLGWALRDMRNLAWVTAPLVSPLDAHPPMVITWSPEFGGSTDTLPYTGSQYRVQTRWLPSELAAASVQSPQAAAGVATPSARRSWLRWAFYREAKSAPPQADMVTLWTLAQ